MCPVPPAGRDIVEEEMERESEEREEEGTYFEPHGLGGKDVV